jgi:AraC family transcriptional regulator, exoenzyme S synthesis regulatory protein ExsA
MLNLYQALKGYPPFSKQLVCRGMLFTNYDCPQVENRMQLFIEYSFIVFVLSGRRIYHWQKHSWELKEGCCAFVKKGGLIAERPGDEGWCVMAFFVPDDFLVQLVRENVNVIPGVKLPAISNEPLIMLDVNDVSQFGFLSMLPYFTQVPAPPENLIKLKFKELVLSLLINADNGSLLSYINILNNKSEIPLEQIMGNNFSFRLTVADFAKLSCKSISAFKRDFKKQFNDSPARWLMTKRLDTAKQLLETTSNSITEISMDCGFENANHFSRVFKQKVGVPPLQYRRSRQHLTI